ncbi:MAG: hypothetical protein Q9162_006214 [Coniocarpon cinnabarinum]
MGTFSVKRLALASSVFSFATASIHCSDVVADGVKWDITPLEGPRSVYQLDIEDTSHPTNTTFSFDLCHTLHHHREEDETECLRGSWVCGFKRDYDPDSKETSKSIKDAWSIAGTFASTGGQLEDKVERIKGSSSESDAEQGLEGVRIHLQGGKVDGKPAKMIASLVCDKDANRYSRRATEESRDDGDEDGDEPTGSETSKPQFVSYGPEPIPGDKKQGINYVLRVKWKSVHACEDDAAKSSSGAQGSWGFFTWFIIILFLLAAAYLIFGSWLNYNRHGARGWDLLPHGDTIRDIPYLLKDWGRAIIDTVQGTHTRGGYNQI